ncbi:MAG: NADH-quinone oxidoreductase subunit C [Candidatus Margulisiibacteriota bacterium]
MSTDPLLSLKKAFPDAILEMASTYNFPTVVVEKESLMAIFSFLYKPENGSFQFLTDLCGIHHPESTPPALGVVYHLHSLQNNVRLRIKAYTPVETATFPSLTGLFAAANWMERETYDFFGIHFEGHPNLIRILNEDNLSYFPMRKEYALEDDTRTDKQDDFFGRE